MVETDLDPAEIHGWAIGLSALHQRIAKHFVPPNPASKPTTISAPSLVRSNTRMAGRSPNMVASPRPMASNDCLHLPTGMPTKSVTTCEPMSSSTSATLMLC